MRDAVAKEKLQKEAGHEGTVLTIADSKGLEFKA